MATKRIRVNGVRREQIDAEMYALALWLESKRGVQEKRERQAEDKRKRKREEGGDEN